MKVIEAFKRYTGVDVSHCLCRGDGQRCDGLICVYETLGYSDPCAFLVEAARILVGYASGGRRSARMVYCDEDENEAGFEEVEEAGPGSYRVVREFTLKLGLEPTTLEELEEEFFA